MEEPYEVMMDYVVMPDGTIQTPDGRPFTGYIRESDWHLADSRRPKEKRNVQLVAQNRRSAGSYASQQRFMEAPGGFKPRYPVPWSYGR